MKQIKMSIVLLIIALSISSINSFAIDDEKTQRVQASFLLALGRKATANEVRIWSAPNPTMMQLMDKHKVNMPNEKYGIIVRAYWDAFGRKPTDGEVTHWSKSNYSYTELMKQHVNWLRSQNGENEATIHRAFTKVRGTNADAEELKAWKNKGVRSYLMLVGILQATKPQAGTKRLLGFFEDMISALSSAINYCIVGKTVQKEIFNLVGHDGSSLIGNDGASLIGNDGGSLLAAGAGKVKVDMSLIGNDGGSMVAAGGGN